MIYFNSQHITYRINAELINETPLSIGAGRGALFGGIDNPIIRMNGIPFIPGSSIKGVLRAEAEKYANVKGWPVCDVVSNPNYEMDMKENLKDKYEPCIVCSVFGGPTVASQITVLNATPIGECRTETRTCVSICRITGGQYPGRLFDIEYITPHSRFEWGLIIEGYDIVNGVGREVELINYLIKKLINDGVWIGGRRSVGHGLVKMNIRKISRESIVNGELKSEDCTDKYLKLLGVKH
ncbi:MAG: CRISPR-associated RAMP protein Csx7 [Candidatus Methanomethylicia archaeon]